MSLRSNILSQIIITVLLSNLLTTKVVSQINVDSLIESKRFLSKKYYDSGHYFESEKALNELLELKTIYTPEKTRSIGNTYTNLGVIYKLTHRIDKALEYYDKAEYIYKNLVNDPGRLLTLYYNKSSLYLNKNDYYRAERYLNEVTSILDTIETPSFFDMPLLLVALGTIDIQTNKIESALELFKKAEKEFSNDYQYSKNRIIERILYSLLDFKDVKNNLDTFDYYYKLLIDNLDNEDVRGLVHYQIISGRLKQTLNPENNETVKHFFRAYNLMRNNYSENHPLYARVFSNITSYFYQRKNFYMALDYIQKALINLSDGFNEMDYTANPAPDSIRNFEPTFFQLKYKILSLFSLYQNKNDINFLFYAKETSEYTLSLVEKLKWKYDHENHKYYISEAEIDIFKIAEAIYYELYEVTEEKHYLNRAFELTERCKAFSLLINLREEQAMAFGGIPQNLVENESEILKKISTYTEWVLAEKIKESPDQQKLKTWENSLFKLNSQHDQLVRFFESNYPDYYKLKYDTRVISPDVVRRNITPNQALVEYSLSDSVLYTYVITNRRTKVFRQNIDTSLRSLCLDFYNTITTQSFSYDVHKTYKNYVNQAYELYEILVKPIEKEIHKKNVIIIPDAEISYVSFDALIKQKANPDKLNYYNLPYLLYDHGFSSSFSATVQFMPSIRKTIPEKPVLAYAPTYENISKKQVNIDIFREDDHEKLIRIPGVQKEVEEISAQINTDVFNDYIATESSFKSNAANYKVLHLAMHTILDDKDPLYSRLAFTQLVDSLDDGFLHTYEVYNMQINADLAVLSSCNSGFGSLQEGEGIQSLARGFAYAGCPSILMTLWEVADQSTVDLMESFYHYLNKGYSKPEALHKSKIDFLDNADMLKSNPFFWSSFTLVGEPNPIFTNRDFTGLLNFTAWVLPLPFLLLSFRNYKREKYKLKKNIN